MMKYIPPFVEQFSKLEIEDRKNYLNNKLPRWTDSINIAPVCGISGEKEYRKAYLHMQILKFYIEN